MNAFEAMAVGAVGMVVVAALCYAAWKVTGFVMKVSALIQRGVVAAEAIQQELAYMRSLTQVAGMGTVDGVNLPQQQTGQYGPERPQRGVVPFPAPLFDRFPQEEPPDATMDDTDVNLLNQTEEELAQMEILETMRQSGRQVEDSDEVHPGVVAESK